MQAREQVDDSWYNPEESEEGRLWIRFDKHPVINEFKSSGGTFIVKELSPKQRTWLRELKEHGIEVPDIPKDKEEEYSFNGAGYPVHDEVEYIEIAVPGDKTNLIHRPIRADDKKKFAKAYAAWKSDAAQAQQGMPLSELPGISRAQVEDLKYFKVFTVEQLAGLTDGNAQNIGPILALRRKATAYLERAKGNATENRIQAQLKERDNEVDTLKRQREEQGEELAKLQRRLVELEKHTKGKG
jgi:hypothetical protein